MTDVKKKKQLIFAQNSTAPLDKRYDLLDSVDDMFKVIQDKEMSVKRRLFFIYKNQNFSDYSYYIL